VPALFVTGERDTFGPPALLREFVGSSGRIVIVAGADHFFEGKLGELETTIERFLFELPVPVARS
jgi:alpha/beta superfamily hydrolase